MVINFIQPSDVLEGGHPHKRIETLGIHPVASRALLTI